MQTKEKIKLSKSLTDQVTFEQKMVVFALGINM